MTWGRPTVALSPASVLVAAGPDPHDPGAIATLTQLVLGSVFAATREAVARGQARVDAHLHAVPTADEGAPT